ncbi:MAG: glycosyltransferase family 2 protein, partial [Candidatus Tectimicrobiota bacterium]
TLLREYRRRQQILTPEGNAPGPEREREDGGLEERDWVSAACLLVRRQAIEEVGVFDENFFLYYEDVDLCTRLRRAGWRVYYDPTVTVIHHRGASCRLDPAGARRAYRQSQRYFWRKHHGVWGSVLLEGALAVKAAFS